MRASCSHHRADAADSLYPLRLERAYQGELLERIDLTHQVALRRMASSVGRRVDAEEGEEAPLSAFERAQLLAAIASVDAIWRSRQAPDPSRLGRLFDQADRAVTVGARRDISRAVRTQAGRDLGQALLDQPVADAVAMRRSFIDANISLIKSIDARYFRDLGERVEQAYAGGRTWSWLSRSMQRRYQVSRSRGQLIGRDQMGKLVSQVTEVRHRELGVERYQRLTANDERVRRSHERLAGMIFFWSQPPAVGHPGMDFQCRCTARAVLTDEHARQLIAEADRRAVLTSNRLAVGPLVTGEVLPLYTRRLDPQRIAEFAGQFRQVA